jgi:hypothetical protein
MGDTVMPLPSARMATTATTLMPARPTDTMVRRGLTADYLSAPARGSVVAMDSAAAIEVATTGGQVMAMDGQDMAALA